jgi:hypothetical protein
MDIQIRHGKTIVKLSKPERMRLLKASEVLDVLRKDVIPSAIQGPADNAFFGIEKLLNAVDELWERRGELAGQNVLLPEKPY